MCLLLIVFPWFKNTFAVLLPFNFWSYILLLGFSIAAFFSPVVRSFTKSFPMVTIICLIFQPFPTL